MSSPAQPAPRRRWRFTLRTLLIVVTVLAVWFGWLTDRAMKQRRAVEVVRALGGEVRYAHQQSAPPGETVEPWAPKWLRDALGQDYFVTVVSIRIHNTYKSEIHPAGKITHDDCAAIGRVSWLKEVELIHVPLSDSGLAHLRGLRNLEWLTAIGSSITDDGLANVAGLSRLKGLDLGRNERRTLTRITDRGLHHLRGLANLKELALASSEVTDQGLAFLCDHLPSLQWLHLAGAQVTDEGLRALTRCPKPIEWLTLQDMATGDEGLQTIARFTELIGLDLTGSKVTDAGLAHLKPAKVEVADPRQYRHYRYWFGGLGCVGSLGGSWHKY